MKRVARTQVKVFEPRGEIKAHMYMQKSYVRCTVVPGGNPHGEGELKEKKLIVYLGMIGIASIYVFPEECNLKGRGRVCLQAVGLAYKDGGEWFDTVAAAKLKLLRYLRMEPSEEKQAPLRWAGGRLGIVETVLDNVPKERQTRRRKFRRR